MVKEKHEGIKDINVFFELYSDLNSRNDYLLQQFDMDTNLEKAKNRLGFLYKHTKQLSSYVLGNRRRGITACLDSLSLIENVVVEYEKQLGLDI